MLSLTKTPKEYSDTEHKHLVMNSIESLTNLVNVSHTKIEELQSLIASQELLIKSQTDSISKVITMLEKIIKTSTLTDVVVPTCDRFEYGKYPIVVTYNSETLYRFAYNVLPNGDCIAWLEDKKKYPPTSNDTRLWKKGTWYKIND
jgi:hypothetical protein